MATTSTPAANGGAAEPPANLPASALAEIRDTLKNLGRLNTRAAKGDRTAQRQICQFIDRPEVARVVRDLARRARDALISLYTGDDWLKSEVTRREMDRVRAALLGPAPSPVERLLAERVAIGWLEVHAAEFRLLQADSDWREHWQKQVDHAHRRFLSALRMLTSVRQLPRPAVQVNIADQQVNVCGVPPPCDDRPPRG
jgi:hypothetical protein